MKCERYARGLPRVVRRTLANLPTCQLVGLLGSRRLGGVRGGAGAGELVGAAGERSRGGAVYPGVRRGKREQVGELQGVGCLGRATGGGLPCC